MKVTKELLRCLEIDKYLDWVKYIYSELPKAGELFQYYTKELKHKKFRKVSLKINWRARQYRLLFNGEINEDEANKRILRLNDKLERKYKEILKSLKEQIDKYSDIDTYSFFFIPSGEISDQELKHTSKNININAVSQLYEASESYKQYEINKIEKIEEINPLIYETRLTEGLKEDFEILTYISEKRFSSNFEKDEYFVKWSKELGDLKLLQHIVKREDQNKINETGKPLKWLGKVTHLGFVMRLLAESGFIEYPLVKSGELNASEYSKGIIKAFDFEGSPETLAKSLTETGNNMENKNKDLFNIPHIKDISEKRPKGLK